MEELHLRQQVTHCGLLRTIFILTNQFLNCKTLLRIFRMTIFRTQHQKNYTVVNNAICTDNRLSWKAKGIWLYAFSRKDDWTFYLCDLIKQSTDGKDSVSAGLKELEKCGYLKRSRKRDEKGRVSDAEWVFHETPFTVDCEPKPEKPILDNPILDNPPLTSTDYLTSTNVVVVRESDLSQPVENVHNSKLSKDDLYRVALTRKWTPDEVELGWTALKNSKYPVTDEIEYVGGVIKKTRITTQTKIENLTKEEIQCNQTQSKKSYTHQQPYKNKTTSNRPNKKDLDSSKPRLNTYKEHISEKDTSEHLLANFEAELMRKIRSSNS